MKSVIAQASSISAAIKQAWTDAGMPTEFTVKVLDFGEKNFLGFQKRPAVVSVLYVAYKQSAPSKADKVKQVAAKPRPQQNARQKTTSAPSRTSSTRTRPDRARLDRNRPDRTQSVKENTPQEEREFWAEPLQNDLTAWLKELTSSMKITIPFKTDVEKKTLTVTFEQNLMEAREDERYLFSGLSFLLIQFLKKKHKKKFQGYRLLIASKR